MKPKIAIIIERADVELGGAERSVSELADALATLDYDTHIIAAKGRTGQGNVHILCSDLPGKRTGFSAFAGAVRNHLAQNHYDVIHSVLPFDFADIYQPRGGTYAESIVRNVASYRSKLAELWKRVTGFSNLRRAELMRAERKLCELRDGPLIVAISNYVARQFSRHYGVETSRITVIPNGVGTPDSGDREQIDRLRTQIFTQLGISQANEAVLFLFAANNFRLKGLGCLMEAMKLVSARHVPRPAFLIVAGSDKTAHYRHLAARLNVDGQVLFLGEVAHIGNVMAVADVAVLPTFYDPCSRFILEALAAGKPVITTKFNGASELFADNRHGRVIDRPDNITVLADALAHFTEPANIQKASQAIMEDNIQQKVSISRVAGQLKKVYDAILAKRRQQ
ncbi:MAG: glycosyltransferase family 4 protein [Sedimentisphaerales bacterium]|jgi:UDP-glucose:(heptosyl)LPS alpha-1,3-glucosyltransferase